MSGASTEGGLLAKLEQSNVFRGLVISSYLGSNISLNMINKWTLSFYGFKFPLTMGIAHMAFSFLALAPIMMMPSFRPLHVPALKQQGMGLVAVAAFFALNVGFNNVSLLLIPLSLNQVIRASIPIAAAVGSVFIERKNPTQYEFSSLFVLFLGIAISVWEGSMTGISIMGTVLCLAGTVCNGLMMSSLGYLLSEKVDVLRLTFYTAPVVMLMLLPFSWFMESKRLAEYQRTEPAGYVGLVLLGCVNALFYNMVHTYVIKVTSSVTTTVIGEMKIVLILVLSSFMLGEYGIWTWKLLLGSATAVLGFCMYSHAKLSMGTKVPHPLIRGMPELALAGGSGGSRASQQADPERATLLNRSPVLKP